MRLFPVSATKRLPSGPSASPEGVLKDAAAPAAIGESFAAAGKRGDVSIRRDLSNAITLTGISDINCSVAPDCNTKWI